MKPQIRYCIFRCMISIVSVYSQNVLLEFEIDDNYHLTTLKRGVGLVLLLRVDKPFRLERADLLFIIVGWVIAIH